MTSKNIYALYESLFSHYGDLGWWPADTPYEVMVGAVLTQNTAWTNVEKAIARFGKNLSPQRVLKMPIPELEETIRPAGFYKQKSGYLKNLTEWYASYDFDEKIVRSHPLQDVRAELLSVRGVGNETADSILLYAFGFPSFVVDAYTMRLFGRYPIDAGKTYMEIKRTLEDALPCDVSLYSRFHALIVEQCKEYCKKAAACENCPLASGCKKIFE